jgi:hypothetical protein
MYETSVDQLNYSLESIKLNEIDWAIQIQDKKYMKSCKLVAQVNNLDLVLRTLLFENYGNDIEGNHLFLKAADYQKFSKDLKENYYSMVNESYLDKAIAVILSYEKIIELENFIRGKADYKGCWQNNKNIRELRICLDVFQVWQNLSFDFVPVFYHQICSLINEEVVQYVKMSHQYLINEPFYMNASELHKILGLKGKANQKSILEPFYMRMNLPKSPFKQEQGRKGFEEIKFGMKHENCAFETFKFYLQPLNISRCELWEKKNFEIVPVQNNIRIIVKPDAIGESDRGERFPVEFKCPFSKKPEMAYIKDYWLQIQCEIQALKAELGYFVIWTYDETQIYEIQRDDKLWNEVEKILLEIYKTSPPSFPDDDVVNNLKILVEESLYNNSEYLQSVKSKHQQSCFITEDDED